MLKISPLALAFFVLAVSISCSSIKKQVTRVYLKGFEGKKARPAHRVDPPAPYEKQEHPVLDALWWNPKTSSSISYFSNCSKIEVPLKDFQKSSFPVGEKYKILKKTSSGDHLYTILEMRSLGEKTYTGIYTFQKGNCYFNINLVSSSYSHFQKEEPVFQTFIRGFRFQ